MFKEIQSGLAKAAKAHNIEFKSDLDQDTILGLMAASVVQELLPKPQAQAQAPKKKEKPEKKVEAKAQTPPAAG